MSDLRVFSKQLSIGRAGESTWVAARALRDGSPVVVPWYQALVFESKVFGINIGSITTPIAGHAAIDADQPEGAVRVTDGYAGLPLFLSATVETGATTLALQNIMFAVSNIGVGAGTSTAETPLNLNLANPVAAIFPAHSAYTGNGTDPLTAGNFQELARQGYLIDSDAAVGVIAVPRLEWAAGTAMCVPVVSDVGSILVYAEAAASALFATVIWAELSESDFSA